MAVRFSADGQDYTRALALGAQANYTVTCWTKLSVDRNSWQTAWSLDNGTGDVDVLQTDSDGTTMELYSDGNNPVIVAMTVGTWYFIAISRAGTGGTGYHRTAATNALTTVSLAGSSSSTNMATLRIGESPFTGEWLNGCVSAFKFWNVTLTQAEIDQESRQYVPVRLANLVSFHPLVRAETTDYSGNARTLSGGTGATTEDGPSLTWHGTRARLVLPSGAPVTSVNVSTATATGVANDASVAASAPVATATAVGVASSPTTTVGVVAAAATAAGVSGDVSTATTVPVTTAIGVGTAHDVSASTSQTVSVDVAGAAGSVPNATVDTAVNVAVGGATGAGIASAEGPNVAPVAATATTVGVAFDATTTGNANVIVNATTATGTAYDALVTTGNDAVAQAGLANAVGASPAIAINLDVAALAPATGNVVAHDSTVTTEVTAIVGLAHAGSSALDPTVLVDNDQFILVEVAVGTGTAFDVTILGALPVGRIRVSGNEPITRLSGRATREPANRVSGREPRSAV